MLNKITDGKSSAALSNVVSKSKSGPGRKRNRVEEQIASPSVPIHTAHELLRIVRAAQPISRTAVARRLGVNRGTVTVLVKPLLDCGVLREGLAERAIIPRVGRPAIGLSLRADREFLVGVNLGVDQIKVGAATAAGQLLSEEVFATPRSPAEALAGIRSAIRQMRARMPERSLMIIGVSVPGPTDMRRKRLLYAPHLGWRNVDIAAMLDDNAPVIVENNATAAAIYEAQRRRSSSAKPRSGEDFVLVRSGTGIGVGLVLGGEVFRGAGGADVAGEFGHMTIVAGGKPCVCGNRGCWERYASAASAVELYRGQRPQTEGRPSILFRDVVSRAEAGELRAKATLERVGESLGIGIGNIICGLGIPQVVVSGRIVRGWQFIKAPLREAVGRTMAGRLAKWSIEAGEVTGSSLGGAVEVAIENYLRTVRLQARACA